MLLLWSGDEDLSVDAREDDVKLRRGEGLFDLLRFGVLEPCILPQIRTVLDRQFKTRLGSLHTRRSR